MSKSILSNKSADSIVAFFLVVRQQDDHDDKESGHGAGDHVQHRQAEGLDAAATLHAGPTKTVMAV